MRSRIEVLAAIAFVISAANAQSQSPNVSQVLMYSGTMPSMTVQTLTGAGSFTLTGAVPSLFTETGKPASLQGDTSAIPVGANYSVSRSFVQLSGALNASIATALSIIPLSSPASGVIEKKDPVTGALLPESSTLGPIFTERAETIGKGRFYIGFSNQDYHFTKYNGASLNALSLLYTGGAQSSVSNNGTLASAAPMTLALGMDVRLSQNITFLTYGLTDRFDVSVGLPVVHSSISARTYNGTIYAGDGYGGPSSSCWCADTFTPGYPTLTLPQIGQSALGKTGFGDVLVRVKGTVLTRPNAVVAIGGDVRLPTGSAENFLGVGTTTVKPFTAVSFYSRPMGRIVFSPHFDVGWQFSGKSVLGGQLEGTQLSQSTSSGTVAYIGAPFTSTRGYLPDVLNWAVGTEVALNRRNTVIVDILGNQVGLIHGIPNTTTQSLRNLSLPTGPNGTVPTDTPTPIPVVSGLVSADNVSYGQYYASLGYKARVMGNLVANFNFLIRLDNNGLVAKYVPLFGLGYSF